MNTVKEVYESLAAELARLAGREGVLDLVEARDLAAVRRQQAAEGRATGSDVLAPPPVAPLVAAAPRVPATRSLTLPAGPWNRRVVTPDRLLGVALAVLALLAVLGMLWLEHVRSRGLSPSAPASADLMAKLPATSAGVPAPPAAAELPGPPILVFSDAPDDAAAARVSADLARWIAPGLGQRIEAARSAGWADALSQTRSPGHLAIVRYDALQSLRTTRPAGSAALRVVAPLYREDVKFLVRSDSPLHFIHELEGRRINVGDPRSSRALTTRTVYARMFGHAPATRQLDTHDEAAGLTELIAGRIDVLVHVGDASLPKAVGGQPPSADSRVRMLSLDATNPAARKALQQFLPSRTAPIGAPDSRAAPDTVPTLAVMSFLVTSEPDGPASRERLGRLVHALCAAQRGAAMSQLDPLWRSVDPSMQPDVGWPYDEAAARELGMCSQSQPSPRSSR